MSTSASQAYVPPDEKDDEQLTAVVRHLEHGVKPTDDGDSEGGTWRQITVETAKFARPRPC